MKRYLALFILIFSNMAFSGGDPAFNNVWKIIPTMSSEATRYNRNLEMDIRVNGDEVIIITGRGRRYADTLTVVTDGKFINKPITQMFNATTIYQGLHPVRDGGYKISAAWQNEGRTLLIKKHYDVEVAQGKTTLKESHVFELNKNHEFLKYEINRESRTDNPMISYTFKVKDSMNAFVTFLDNDWDVQGGLDRQAMMIGLEGLVNRNAPNFYCVYPEEWQFTYTKRLYEWYGEKRGYTFTTIETPKQAVEIFRDYIKGYVVWDKNVRTSLIVAFTIAGLNDAVVASEDQIPMLDSLGLSMVKDLRGIFTDKNDAEIYQWAKDKYWDQCSRKYIIWLGGHSGKVLLPGVADWGVAQRAFMQDLSTDPKDTDEYNLAKQLLGDMDSDALVMGWHSYGKDSEGQHVTLCSGFGLPVEGLHSLPNVSFEHQIGFSEGFEFKNNHNIEPGKKYIPENKVYIACVQTDGIGIGAWLKPGRGEIPYAWETLMNYSWLMPSLLEFFYSTSTPNDYFIGCLSGPGYMYPKSVPPDKLPGLLKKANGLMEKLDLRVFDIMDHSRGVPRYEYANLTKSVVDAYYEAMPNAIGFVNGYRPANTYDIRNGVPMISFEYYLSPTVSEEKAAADLIELGSLNKKRPYFLLLHIRETSDVARVKSILNRLPEDYELVPLDIFLKMAGEKPGFEKRYIE